MKNIIKVKNLWIYGNSKGKSLNGVGGDSKKNLGLPEGTPECYHIINLSHFQVAVKVAESAPNTTTNLTITDNLIQKIAPGENLFGPDEAAEVVDRDRLPPFF